MSSIGNRNGGVNLKTKLRNVGVWIFLWSAIGHA